MENEKDCKCKDPIYTIKLNSQGPQGRQGERGLDGFSPQIEVNTNTSSTYTLNITTNEGTITTPNLKYWVSGGNPTSVLSADINGEPTYVPINTLALERDGSNAVENFGIISTDIGFSSESFSIEAETVTINGKTPADKDEVVDLSAHLDAVEDDLADLNIAINNVSGEVDNLELSKQDKLVAGQNITIEGNVISATGGGGGEVTNPLIFTKDTRDSSGSGVVASTTIGSEATDSTGSFVGDFKADFYDNGVLVGSNSDKVLLLNRVIAGNNINITRDQATGRVTINSTASGVEVDDVTIEVNGEGKLQTTVDINALEAKVEDLELFKFPNATIVGDPLIESGQVSRFSNTTYMQFPFIVDVQNRPFVIDFAFTTNSNVTTQQNIIDSYFGIALAIANGKGLMALSSNGSSWDIGSIAGSINIQPNTTYYAKLSWDGTTYKTALSTNGEDYVDDMVVANSNSPFPTTIYIGGSPDLFGSGSSHPFLGGINMNKAFLTIQGLVVWQGMDDVGMATRADVSLSNLDTAGEAKIRNTAYHPPLLSCMWSDHLIDNMDWLRGDTFSWQDGNVYKTAYDTLASEYATGTDETEDNITFKRTANGYKIADASQEANIVAKYNTDGIAWYYIVDTANKRFKLPRTKWGFKGLRSNVGNPIDESLPNITGHQSFMSSNLYNAFWGAFYRSRTGSQAIVGSGTGGAYDLEFDASRSSSTYQDNAPVQERGTQMYLYFYVGEFSREAIEQTAGLNAELFNSKADLNDFVEVPVIIDTYVNGTSGYRVWSKDSTGYNYCEQWGNVPAGATATNNMLQTTINLLLEYKDLNYSGLANCTFNGGTAWTGAKLSSNTIDTIIVESWVSGTSRMENITWRTWGYLAEGQYDE